MVDDNSYEGLGESFKGRTAREGLRDYFEALRAKNKKPAEHFGVLSREEIRALSLNKKSVERANQCFLRLKTYQTNNPNETQKEDKVQIVDELERLLENVDAVVSKAIFRKHLHTTLLYLISRGENEVLSRIARWFKSLGKERRASYGLDEEQELKLYRSGIIAWFSHPQTRGGILSLFGWPRKDLDDTLFYLATRVREKYPEVSKLIDEVVLHARG